MFRGNVSLSELPEFSLQGLGDGSETISLKAAGALRVVPGNVERLKCFSGIVSEPQQVPTSPGQHSPGGFAG